jgi:NADPH:quinone reductase-like Zn-dependent oxidoreductase
LSLPLGHLLLHVIDDETDVVDHRALRAPGPRRISERQIDQNAGEPDGLGVAALDQFAAHAEKNLLVGFRVQGKVKPHVQTTFPLASAAEALALVEQGHSIGKVVLRVG